MRGARWLSGRVSDSGARGRGFETYRRRVVSIEQDTLLPESTGKLPRKRWLRPNMTEKLLTGTLSLNTNKQKLIIWQEIMNNRNENVKHKTKHLVLRKAGWAASEVRWSQY